MAKSLYLLGVIVVLSKTMSALVCSQGMFMLTPF